MHHMIFPFSAWCLLKGHTYLIKRASAAGLLNMCELLVDTRHLGVKKHLFNFIMSHPGRVIIELLFD